MDRQLEAMTMNLLAKAPCIPWVGILLPVTRESTHMEHLLAQQHVDLFLVISMQLENVMNSY